MYIFYIVMLELPTFLQDSFHNKEDLIFWENKKVESGDPK